MNKTFLRHTVPGLLVLIGKHHKTYVHVATHEELAQAALNILTSRLKSERYYFAPGEEPKRPDVGDFDALPVALRNEAHRVIKRWQGSWNAWADGKVEWDEIQAAVQTKNGEAAWDILCRRSGAEYEDIRLECYTSIADLVGTS